MNTVEFWSLIAEAGNRPAGVVADLASREPADIVAFDRHLRRVLAASQSVDLFGAAYLVNGGCSHEGFDAFRGWLMAQGREAFARAVGDPDSLADLPAVRRAAVTGEELESPAMLRAAAEAHLKVTGTDLPAGPEATPRALPDGSLGSLRPRLTADSGLDAPRQASDSAVTWANTDDFWDFDDEEQVAQRLPRLAALFNQAPD
ncbi:DUF4240 domain-containing protein [Phytohabitans rumicis]|uniref:DUF4240 domain-containing protein n=1 Tax=Phytohabitans rumicis TaxID=1076125 RepID=A0A6V8L6Y7_9ACTN|nr:DUF4240 domain-containing protein [Phytohabitans rumicis]GFJ92034.1 hypothetical protein Prum_056760 [Phytohabitans rumicis]